MAQTRQRKHLSLRLELLEEQRDRLSSAVSHRANKVIQLGKSWLAGKKVDKGKTLSYKEISDLIEDTDKLLAQQIEQLSDDDQKAFKTETPGDTLTSSSHSTATASQSAVDHHRLSADAEMLKSALARIQNLEESMASLQTNRGLDAVTVIQDVAEPVPKVSRLEDQQQTITPAVAVTSYVQDITPKGRERIERWTCKAGDTGGHFDVNTGMFTAPFDGHYGLILSMWQHNEGRIELHLHKTPSGSIPSVINDEIIFLFITNKHESGDSGFSFTDLKAGEKLYICAQSAEKNPTLKNCTFSILLLK